MKMMIWKEFRENFKWAILAIIGLGLAEIYGLNYNDPNNYQDQRIITLCKSTYLMATTFGCALSGLFLGFLQILPEQRRDQWAMLMHRPVSRGTIFRGKVVAGILLYLLATLPPFLLCVWLVATPGHFVAPFVPGMILAGVADIGAGLVYYFAALFLALQRGAWVGARVLGLFAAVYTSFFIGGIEIHFHTAIMAEVLMGTALFTAGWGAILSNGLFKIRPWPGKVALLAVVLYGLGGLGEMSQMILNTGGGSQGSTGPQYKFTKEGEPLIVNRDANLKETVTDLEGHVINDSRYIGLAANENLLFLSQVAAYVGDAHGLDLNKRFPRYRNAGTYVFGININDGLPHPVAWFWLEKAKYFVGISAINKMPVQIIDRKGFQPWNITPESFQFGENIDSYISQDPAVINEGREIHVIDFIHEKIFPLVKPEGVTVYSASIAWTSTYVQGAQEKIFVLVTGKELLVYDSQGKPIATLPFHHDVDRYGMVDFTTNAAHDRFFIEYSGSRWIDWSERHLMNSYYEIVDVQGNVIKSYDLPALPIRVPVRTWVDYAVSSGQSATSWYGTVAYQDACGALGIPHYDDRGYNPFYPEWSHPPKVGERILLVSLLWVPIAIFLARGARFSWKRTWAWAIFVYAFNIGGLIAFWLVADWPVNVKCPQCGSKRPVAETTCPHCKALWPAHKPEGIEIFEKKNPVAELVS